MSWPTDATHDPKRRSWIDSANASGTDFPIQNLPFGVFQRDEMFDGCQRPTNTLDCIHVVGMRTNDLCATVINDVGKVIRRQGAGC